MRILIIEDDERINAAIKRGLTQESFAVDSVLDGEEGYDLASSEEYDAIILDLMLPKMDGITLCTKLRNEENVHTPVLMLTAKSTVEDKVTGLDSGADDYLAKPFSFDELLARVRALTRRPRRTLKTQLKIDGLVLDTNSKTVTRDDKNIDLSKKEYSLLKYLMTNRGQVVSKDQLINHVWNFESNVLPNTVEVYVGYLRAKIDKGFNQKLIKTVRGFGYKIG
jgi:DNA-binding response OmpR family regulator